MSKPLPRKRGLAAVLTVALSLVVLPAVAQAAPVDLATAGPFVVLGGQTVTNTGTSVLNGDLGVSPGTALPGFNEAVLNGEVHANDEVAARAQSDLTTAYNVAAGQPVLEGNDLSNTNLGNRTLTAGVYRYTSDALLTGPLTLDAAGDPNAEFVFQIGSALTTASGSSVVMINGASPCNVYWQVGSSATLGTTTAFQGSLMALTSISVQTGATVLGRVLARNGQVSLDDNVLTQPLCPGEVDRPNVPVPPDNPGPNSPGPTTPGLTGSGPTNAVTPTPATGSPVARRTPIRQGRAVVRPTPRANCTAGFRATVSGRRIERVAFSLDGKPIGSRTDAPFGMYVRASPGAHQVTARVTFTDATHAKTKTFPYRACAAAVAPVLHPKPGPPAFTG